MIGVVVCVALTVAHAGCTQAPPPIEPDAADGQPAQLQPLRATPTGPYVAATGRPGGQLTLASTSDPKSFNPILAKETSTTTVTGHLFEGLTRLDPVTFAIEPWLAASWSHDADGRTWTFHLRQDVEWFDGMPLTAEDVVFTFRELIYNPEIPSSARDIFTIDGRHIDVVAQDRHTVVFTLPTPFAPFLMSLSQEILPAHILRPVLAAGTFNSAWGLDTAPNRIVGTGPFRLAAYTPGQSVKLVRNPTYWRRDAAGQRLPYLDAVQYLIVQNQDVALLKFREGEVDLYGLRGSDVAILKPEETRARFTIYDAGPAFGTNFLTFNQNRGTHPTTGQPFVAPRKLRWFTDVRFRRAMAHIIDTQGIIDIVMEGYGYEQVAAMSPSAGPMYNPDVRRYPYDMARARALLDEAGLIDRDGDGIREDADGAPVSFSLVTNAGNTDRIKIAEIIRKDMEAVGLRVHFTQLEFNTLVQQLNATYEWEAMILGLTGGIEPHFGQNVWQSSGQLHMWYPVQPAPATDWEEEIDRLFTAGSMELDTAKRRAIYHRWQEVVAEQLPFIYTVLPPSLVAVRNRFGNLHPTPLSTLHNIDELYISDAR